MRKLTDRELIQKAERELSSNEVGIYILGEPTPARLTNEQYRAINAFRLVYGREPSRQELQDLLCRF